MSNENKNEKELMAIELNNLFSKLNDKEKFVFETIVSNGISEEKEAKEIAANMPFDENMRFISKDTAWRSIITLGKAGFFDLQSIHTGYRTFNILKLTDIGAKLYRLQCRKEPAVQDIFGLGKNMPVTYMDIWLRTLQQSLRKRAGILASRPIESKIH